jgi:endonuclease/exonuclease/phosphatase family metal-dependent hydrolase
VKLFTTFLFSLIVIASYGQSKDTLTIMSYNLLYYNVNIFSCTNNNNGVTQKDNNMKTIIAHTLPDILAVQEMGVDNLGQSARRLMDNALNQDGRNQYALANYIPPSRGSISNALYYNKNKFVFTETVRIERDLSNSFLVRPIDGYTLYYNDKEKLEQGDTTFFTFFSVHLKAGNSASDRSDRADATAAFMNYLENNYKNHNYFILGDFNSNGSSQQDIQNLINHANSSIRFYDPVNKLGTWNNNSLYSDLHTQSTRTTNTNGGCFVGGGMDDRYDIIFVGDEVMNNTRGAQYVNGTYRAVGNDGLRFNNSLIAPTNISETQDVIRALHDMSDHIPVLMKVTTEKSVVSTNLISSNIDVRIINPSDNVLKYLGLSGFNIERIQIQNLSGAVVSIFDTLNPQEGELKTDVSAGIYFVTFISQEGQTLTKKWVVN